jgi:hypothetical protein
LVSAFFANAFNYFIPSIHRQNTEGDLTVIVWESNSCC